MAKTKAGKKQPRRKQPDKKETKKIVGLLPKTVDPTQLPVVYTCEKHGDQQQAVSFNNKEFFCAACFTDFLKKNKITKVEVKKTLLKFDEYTAIAKNRPVKLDEFPRLNHLECPYCGKELEDTDGILLLSNPPKTKVNCSDPKCDFTSTRLLA
jgi:hypothetical protein